VTLKAASAATMTWGAIMRKCFILFGGKNSSQPSSRRWNKFNLVYFVQPNIINYDFSSEGFIICTHTTSLTFDLSHRIRRNYQEKEKKSFRDTKKKKRRTIQERNKRIPLQDGQNNIDVM